MMAGEEPGFISRFASVYRDGFILVRSWPGRADVIFQGGNREESRICGFAGPDRDGLAVDVANRMIDAERRKAE